MVLKKVRVFFSLVIIPLAYYYILSNIDFSRLYTVLNHANVFLLVVAFLTIFVEYFLMAFRWKEVLKEKKISLNILKSYKFLLISMFMNMFLPLRGGDFYKGHISTGDKNLFESSVLVLKDRILDLVLILSVSFFLSLFFFSDMFNVVLVAVGGFGLFVLGIFFIYFVESVPIFHKKYSKIRITVLELLKTDKKTYLMFLTAVIWFFGVFRVLILMRTIGIGKGWVFATFLTFFWAMLSTIPLTPSGMGSTEAVVFAFLVKYGISPEIVGSYVFLNRFIPLLASITVGAYLYFHENFL